MTLHQLKIFVTVAKHLNVTRASEELHITQPSVSRQLKLLAEECGVGLYRPTARGIELTEDGRLFLSNAMPLLLQADNLKKNFSGNGGDRGSLNLRIGGTEGPCLSLLPLLAATFKKTHPGVRIIIRTDITPSIEQLTLKSEIELGVITHPSYAPQLTYEPCRQEKWVVFSSAKHALGRKQRWTLEEVARAPLVLERRGTREVTQTDEMLRPLGEGALKLTIALECDSPQAIKSAVRAGVGLGVLPRDMVEAEMKAGELKIIRIPEVKMELESFIVYAKERPLTPNAVDFLTLLRQQRVPKSRWALGHLQPVRLPSRAASARPRIP